ncbi:outer membrane beta-barrel protein [Phenylobacterium sp.]|uniref:outer membrane beta-barrel protein n=1 Tax=Phenylobacterium sp. TaxID=1871053 RepID=UPI003563D58C
MAALRQPEAVARYRFRYALAGVATLALASAAPAIASAQAVSVGGAAKPLTIGVQERTTYDTDAARGSDQAATLRGLDTADVIYAPSITVDYASGIGRRGLALRGYFGYDYYQKNTTLRREHIDFSAAANTAIGALCTVGAQVAYDRGQSGLEDLTLLVTKNTIQTYTISANESCASTAGLTENVQVSHSAAQNSSATLIDFNTTGVSASVGYGNHALGNISLIAGYNKTTYDRSAVPLAGVPSDLQVSSFGVQFFRPIGMRLSGTAGVFYSKSTSELGPGAVAGQNSSFSGLTANAGLTYHLGPRINLAANLSRAVQATIRQDVGYSINNQASLSADYTVSSRIHANLGASWSREDFRGGVVLVPTSAPNRVDLKSVTAGVSVKLGRTSALSGEVQHEESTTDLALFNFKSDRVSLTLSTSF